jgi:cyclohexa-1,5-dienecarbonyl-CoA hydratase
VSRCILERQGRVATITLTRPPLNVLDLQALDELDGRIATLEQDPELQVLLVRGDGERAFCAGVAVEDHLPERIEPTLRTFHRALLRLWRLEAATVAVVHGHCLGGGLELAAVCDLVVAEESARLGVPEIALGCYPPVAAALFPRLLGWHRALELMLTGRSLTAAEAWRYGLVSRLAPAGQLESEVARLVGEITDHSMAATRALKRASRAAEAEAFPEALAATEARYLRELLATEDLGEGIAAFLEKRPPVWRHR